MTNVSVRPMIQYTSILGTPVSEHSCHWFLRNLPYPNTCYLETTFGRTWFRLIAPDCSGENKRAGAEFRVSPISLQSHLIFRRRSCRRAIAISRVTDAFRACERSWRARRSPFRSADSNHRRWNRGGRNDPRTKV